LLIFPENIIKFGLIDNFSRKKYHVKLNILLFFSYIIFRQKCLAPRVDWAPTHRWRYYGSTWCFVKRWSWELEQIILLLF